MKRTLILVLLFVFAVVNPVLSYLEQPDIVLIAEEVYPNPIEPG